MMDEPGSRASASQDGDDRDEDDEEEYEESGGGNRLLGFMFGNVDNSGDLDVDYLDKDAKEHLDALADKLGSSFSDINLSTKSPQPAADGADEDYDEKAEDAVDYEDIDEQYEGPETQAFFEEDHLLPKKEYFSSEVSLRAAAPLFDDENYDEEEKIEKEVEVVANSVEAETSFPSDNQGTYLGKVSEMEVDPGVRSLEPEDSAIHLTNLKEEEDEAVEDRCDDKSSTPLPILCVEDGRAILRFSEIFCIHAAPLRPERRDRRYSVPKDRYSSMDAADRVEEDEETFLMTDFQGVSSMKQTLRHRDDNTLTFKDDDSESEKLDVTQGVARMDLCYSSEPMKRDVPYIVPPETKMDNPTLYPLDQQDWEDMIIWDDSSVTSENNAESGEISGPDCDTMVSEGMEIESGRYNLHEEHLVESDETDNDCFLPNSTVLIEEIGSRDSSKLLDYHSSERKYHPQLLRLESQLEPDNSDLSDHMKENVGQEPWKSDAITRLSKVTMLNKEIMDGSWLDNIIWDASIPRAKPKLILDLRDEQMLFEISDSKDGKQMGLHAGAMIITRSSKENNRNSSDVPSHTIQSGGMFNIANDNFYSNRKVSQQLKSHLKKRTAHGIKVLHSLPALKLQTNKLKLSNKDIANFHRPRALWYPRDNEVAVKEQGKLSTQGPMKIILKSLGGKGTKLHVDANETVSSVKAKASKKLDFKPTESVRVFYSGKELQDQESLATQSVQPNSLLHLVRTKVHLLPKAQKLPGENKSLRPPGAFKKKSDLSAKDGHIFLMEYCEERPLLLGNVGMGARLCTYYQKSSAGDQTGASLRSGNNNLGIVHILDPADKSPFIGDIKPGCKQSSLETNMYRAPIFPHKVSSTDYLLVRSAKGKLSIRRIDTIHAVGQQEPHMEVMSPGSKGLQLYLMNRLLVYMYREFRTFEQPGVRPFIRADHLSSEFPNISEAFLRKRLKHCADLQRQSNGHWFWVMRRHFRLPLEEELRRMVAPEHVCAYESMLAGLYRLKHLGITRLTLPTSISFAMNQLPDEAIALAAASHIEREIQITPWNLSSNFVTCTNQDRENIERLEITGVGDPSGRGLGFSYVRTAPKPPVPNAVIKKKAVVSKLGANVTGTDADLRRLSMEAAREVLLKFNVPDEQIAKLTRWHRIAMIRKLSSEQAASGVKVDPTTISKYARGQRMSFLQLQQQTREKCQEIWDRQVQSLSAVDGDDNESDSEANSDLDSFAGDLENLLDAEACEEGEEVNFKSKQDIVAGVKGLKMRRNPPDPQAEEEMEDEAAEAAELFRMLLDDVEAERKKKKKNFRIVELPGSQIVYADADRTKKIGVMVKKVITPARQPDGFHATKEIIQSSREVENYNVSKNKTGMIIPLLPNDIKRWGSLNKKVKIIGDGPKHQMIIEKKSARDKFECGACGQLGHMRTNKNCPNYGEDPESLLDRELDKTPGISDSLDPYNLPQQKVTDKRPILKIATKNALVEAVDGQHGQQISTSKAKKLKFKCGTDKVVLGGAAHPVNSETDTDNNSLVEASRMNISKKVKLEEMAVDSHKPSIVFRPPTNANAEQQVDSHKVSFIVRPPADTNIDQYDSHKPAIIFRPPIHTNIDQNDFHEQSGDIRPPIPTDTDHSESHRPSESHKPNIVVRQLSVTDRDQTRKKISIKRPKEIMHLDRVSLEAPSPSFEYREGKNITESSNSEKRRKQVNKQLTVDSMWRENREEARRVEEAKRRIIMEERRAYEEQMRYLEERDKVDSIKRYEETIRIEREEEERQKEKKRKKKRLPEMRDEYSDDYMTRRNDRRVHERGRTTARGQHDAEYAPLTKRRRMGEVGLSNILETIVDILKKNEVSFLFQKPVTKKEAPDYYKVIKTPMDLSTIREKVRKLEYRSREDFRHDVWQITVNAHEYNDRRNPGIPPLADQLLELCDYVLDQNDQALTEAESGIEQ